MAPSRMVSGVACYPYRPWPPMETVPPSSSTRDQHTITRSEQQTNVWPRNVINSYLWSEEGQSYAPFTTESDSTDDSYISAPSVKIVEQNASVHPGDYTWINSFHLPSPYRDTSPWLSSDSSISGDTSNGAWSSSCHSPEPHQRSISDYGTDWSSATVAAGSCVSMSDVQHQPDVEPVYLTPAYQQPPYGQYLGPWSYEQCGTIDHPMMEYPSVPCDIPNDCYHTQEGFEHLCQAEPSTINSPDTEKRKSTRQSHRSMPALTSSVQGTPLKFKPHSSRRQGRSLKTAAFPCPLARYGCVSSFLSKNEWKRHINTQHLRLEAWQCDQCPQRDDGPNDFNRKDLFIQHLRRMHHPNTDAKSAQSKANRVGVRCSGVQTETLEEAGTSLMAAERRCHQRLGEPPTRSACLFCPAEFSGIGSWDDRIEHVARHMEADNKEGRAVPQPSSWNPDRALEEWLIAKRVIAQAKRGWKIVV